MKEFVNREKWVYGSTRNEMFDVVRNGAEEDGMPAYGEVLSDKQVYELIDYILAAIEDKKSADFNSGANEDVVFVSEVSVLLLSVGCIGFVIYCSGLKLFKIVVCVELLESPLFICVLRAIMRFSLI